MGNGASRAEGVEPGVQPAGVGSLFLPCGCQGSNSGHQVWGQVPLPFEPYGQTDLKK